MTRASDRPTLESLRAIREEILRIAAAHDADNIRVFGSVARGEADERSDVDLLVDIPDPVDVMEYFGRLDSLRIALEELLGRSVSILDSRDMKLRPYDPTDKVASIDAAALRRFRDRVLKDAVPL